MYKETIQICMVRRLKFNTYTIENDIHIFFDHNHLCALTHNSLQQLIFPLDVFWSLKYSVILLLLIHLRQISISLINGLNLPIVTQA